MTAFEQAWALLKSNRQEYVINENAAGFDIDAFRSGKLPTPLEERVADRPPVSHIEWNPNTGKYTLRGTGDEALSTLKPGMPTGTSPFHSMPLHNILGETPEPFRRKGYYDKLMRGLLNAGIDIQSNERNPQSTAFHQKFLQNLSPNLEAIYRPDDEGKINYWTPIDYRRKPFPSLSTDFYDEMQERARRKNRPERAIAMSDLARRDYGSIPIRSLPMEYVREPIGTRQTQLADFDPAFRLWELEQEKLKEETRKKNQLSNLQNVNSLMDSLIQRWGEPEE